MVSYGTTFSGTAVTLNGATAATQVLTARITGDADPQFAVDANGKLEWGSGDADPDVSLQRDGSVRLHTVNSMVTEGSFVCDVAGGGLTIREGTNARQGAVDLVAGTATVDNTSVTDTTRIQLTSQVDGGTPGWLRVSARTSGTSFTITSSSATDTSTVAYLMTEPT